MGETRVDLLHLLEDLRDAYPGALEETILTEIVANSLDSGARRIQLAADAATAGLVVVDDGSGMRRRELARYHDIASSAKTRGQGIGFAGVGIKLGLLVCEEVLTETRRGKTHVATRWHLASRHRAPWKWIPPQALVAERGTAVRLKLRNPLSPLLDAGFVEAALRRHYQPLFDPFFAPVLVPCYPRGVAVEVNGRALEPEEVALETAPLEIRAARKRKPSALGYLMRAPEPLPEERRGLAISTLGKVIKHGWDWLGVTPAAPERIGGLIEVPALAECLTLNKADFVRVGPRGATYLAYRKLLQEAVSRQLAAWGDVRDQAEESRRRVARPVERDLERVLHDLADDFPLLATLVQARAGGQRRLPIGKGGGGVDGRAFLAASVVSASAVAEAEPASAAEPPPVGEPRERPPGDGPLPGASGARRPAHHALSIQFEERPGDPELGRLVESTVWVNAAHPAYRRAAASRSDGYHIALAAALALAPLAVEPAHEHAFVTAFLTRWGDAVARDRPAARGTERMGSGTVVDPSGLILTVNYVVLGAEQVRVTLLDQRAYVAEVVRHDYASGLALVRIPEDHLTALPLRRTTDLVPGEEAFIVASVGEGGARVASGAISYIGPFDANWEYVLDRAIMTTAMNPGLGGGPLLDTQGRVLGVVSLNLNEIGRFSLSIPADYYLDGRDALLGGRAPAAPTRAWLGIFCYAVKDHVVIAGLLPGGPGLRSSDAPQTPAPGAAHVRARRLSPSQCARPCRSATSWSPTSRRSASRTSSASRATWCCGCSRASGNRAR